jgi:hypothetical protein
MNVSHSRVMAGHGGSEDVRRRAFGAAVHPLSMDPRVRPAGDGRISR